MYKSFRISGFRLFKKTFEIGGFERINLITGRNNSGKTALLEALFIHCGSANVALPFTVESFRGVTQFEEGFDVAAAGFFADFNINQDIELEGTDKLGVKHRCLLRLVPSQMTLEQPPSETATPGQTYALEIAFYAANRQEPVTRRAVVEGGKLRLDPLGIPPLYNGVFVSTKGGSDHDSTAKRYSNLVKEVGEEERFVNALKIIEPAIRGLRLLNHGGVTMLHANVGLKKFVPLAYVGEGMARLAAILTAIAASRNGVAFVDEIENGLHYTVLPLVWQAITAFADRFNVQVFTTTHSEECVRAAHAVFSEGQYTFRLFRLHRTTEGGVEAKLFDREALEAALKTGLETR